MPLSSEFAPLRFFALFGSVSGVFGNPGQVDYAAANDAFTRHGRPEPSATSCALLARRVVSLGTFRHYAVPTG